MPVETRYIYKCDLCGVSRPENSIEPPDVWLKFQLRRVGERAREGKVDAYLCGGCWGEICRQAGVSIFSGGMPGTRCPETMNSTVPAPTH